MWSIELRLFSFRSEKFKFEYFLNFTMNVREESEHQSSGNNNVSSGKRRENRNEGEDGNETNGFDIEDSSFNPFKPIHQLTSASVRDFVYLM